MAGRWQSMRKFLAPVALILAVVVLANEFIGIGSGTKDVVLVFEFSQAADTVRHLRVDVFSAKDSKSVGFFERRYEARAMPGEFGLPAKAGTYRLQATIGRVEGPPLRVERRFEIGDFERIRFDFGPDLSESDR